MKLTTLFPFAILLQSLGLAQVTNVPANVVLTWELVANAASYRLYYTTLPGTFVAYVETTNTVEAITNLTRGQTYYFAVAAVSPLGLEGDLSEEDFWAVPPFAAPASLQLKQTKEGVSVSGRGEPYGDYRLCRTDSLSTPVLAYSKILNLNLSTQKGHRPLASTSTRTFLKMGPATWEPIAEPVRANKAGEFKLLDAAPPAGHSFYQAFQQ